MTSALTPPQPGEPMWIGAKVLLVDIEVDRDAAAAWLPAPLTLTDPPIATLFVADYPETRFGSEYREAAVTLHASDNKGLVGHCLWMVVDDDTALILGREMLGFPKKMADISLDVGNDRVFGVVERHGEVIMRLEADLGATVADPEPVFSQRAVNLFGSIIGGMKLLELQPASETIHFYREAEATVLLGRTSRDPLGDLKPGNVTAARFVVCDFGLGDGLPMIVGDVDALWSMPKFLARAM